LAIIYLYRATDFNTLTKWRFEGAEAVLGVPRVVGNAVELGSTVIDRRYRWPVYKRSAAVL
jgi:hypothetical protein